MALAIDQEARPRDALVLAEALRDGANGVEPVGATAPTSHLGTAAATRVLPSEEPETAATRIAPARAPRTATHETPAPSASGAPVSPAPRVAPRRPAPARAAAAPAARRRKGLRRLGGLLAILAVFIVAVIAAVAISTSTSSNVVKFRNLVAKDVNTAVQDVQNLIDQNTK
jgi:hypothetical protein